MIGIFFQVHTIASLTIVPAVIPYLNRYTIFKTNFGENLLWF